MKVALPRTYRWCPLCQPSSSSRTVSGGHRRTQQPIQRLTARLQAASMEDAVLTTVDYDIRPAPRPPPPDPMALLQRLGLLNGCEPDKAPLSVAVLLSGGVDSSLALRLLQAAGHHVTAYYLQIWFQEDFRNTWDVCPWEDDLANCQQVCSKLGVELKVVPLTQQYWDRVVAHSIGEIRAGRTPNPDMLCNSRVKFGAFTEFLETNAAGTYDRVASGHYARLLRDAEGQVALALTPDAVKDQTYFLANLSRAQLSRALFPLADFTKAEVRQLAAAYGLPNNKRPDSQGICFLGKVRFEQFVAEHLGHWRGPILEEESGTVLGYHDGFWFHTIGQRRGIHLSGGPWFVARKDSRTNTVYVSKDYYAPSHARNTFRCGPFNWIGDRPCPGRPLQCKVRHGPQMYECHLNIADDGQSAVATLDRNDQGLAPGQYAVFYQDGVCLGAAMIQEAL